MNFDDEFAVERIVGEARERNVVVWIQSEALGIALRRIFLAFVGELLRQFAKVVFIHAVQVFLPHRIDFLCIALGNCFNIGSCYVAELVEVEQRVSIRRARCGHGILRNDTVVFQAIDGIIERSTL